MQLGPGGSVTVDQVSKLPQDLHYHIYSDNFFSSPNLVNHPTQLSIDYTSRTAPSAHITMLLTVSRTARLWIQYTKYVDVVKTVLKAERLGDWAHLVGISKVQNLFAATGHCAVQYAKCARLYL